MTDIVVIEEQGTTVVEVTSPGPQGASGVMRVGSVTTGPAGSQANVTNSGTTTDAVFNFTIPRGDVGDVTPEATAAKNTAEAAAAAALASQNAASGSAAAAATSQSNAAGSATSASASAGTATTKASEASTSAAAAAASQSSATDSATLATNKAAEAASSATAAATSSSDATQSANAAVGFANAASASSSAASASATSSAGSASKAQEWATKTSGEVEAGQGFGAKKYAQDASALANSAEIAAAGSLAHSQTSALHALEASNSADNANASAVAATISSNSAASSASAASSQAATATTQAGNAAASAATATSQASSATASASTASTQAGIATTKASEAATSASAASVSAAAALASQTASAGSAAAANTSAGSAAGSAANALAIYGTTNAQQAALVAAQSAASLAQGYALSASSAIQQDLSGVTAQALHRSPNAVTAMFIYDTSKDSDGGAWTEKCQHTSWYNEAINGKWLGAHVNELNARNDGSTVGNEILTSADPGFGSATGWTLGTNISIADGKLVFAATPDAQSASAIIPATTVGAVYRLQIKIDLLTAGTIRLTAGGTTSDFVAGGVSTQTRYITATNTSTSIAVQAIGTTTASVDLVSIRLVTATTTQTGDYFQLTTDGKFYRLNATSGTTEVFRGNKRDFPRLAGIVAEAASVTIYDLTEPGRPMWMRFIAGSRRYISSYVTTAGVSSLSAVNGILLAGDNGGSGNGLNIIRFAADSGELRSSIPAYNFNWIAGVANRNLNGAGTLSGNPSIVSRAVNAVAMTVLPDAPVDPVTGLKVPTIAVGTASGLNVIRHNGVVATSSRPYGMFADGLSIAGDFLVFGEGANYFSPNFIKLSAITGTSFTPTLLAPNAGPEVSNYTQRLTYVGKNSFATPGAGLTLPLRMFRPNYATGSRGAVTGISNTFNTGHMLGDIRRAYLADVDVGSVSGTELVTNGTFSTSDLTGWSSFNSGTFSIVDGRLQVVGAGTTSTGVAYTFPTTAGKTYAVSVNLLFGTATICDISVIPETSSGSLQSFATYQTTSGVKSGRFVADGSVSRFVVWPRTAGLTVSVDDISIKECSADRSYKSAAAPITGTLTKTEVATAAQLVAYSGFSASNYLREPYSADLELGTSEWSVSSWVNIPASLTPTSFPQIGSEIVTNGSFDDSTGWTLGSGWSITGGQLVATNVTGGLSATSLGTVVAGKFYRVNCTVTITSGSVSLNIGSSGTALSASTNYVNLIVQASTSAAIALQQRGSSFTGTVDNLSVVEINPLVIFDRAFSSGPSIRLGVTGLGSLIAAAFDGTTTRTVTTTAAYNTNTWLKVEADYNAYGTLTLAVKGVDVAVTRGAPLLTLNNSNAVLTIGNSYAGDAPFPGSIALLKMSATVPTAEQSLWMYEQEKQMFRDGAQVTLPDAGSIVDLTYDDATDKWIAVSATNESEWSGLVRTSVTPSPAGSYTKVSAASGVQLQARSTTNPGVDITIPSYGLREELVRRSESAARLARTITVLDYAGGFTANTTLDTASVTGVAGLLYPASYIGARVTGANIQADTFVVGIVGTTMYLTKTATSTVANAQLSFSDFVLPLGYEAKAVLVAGAAKQEGATKDFTRLFDGFKETIRFGTSPAYNAFVQIQATRTVA